MAQNDPHVALIILTTRMWGKNFSRKKIFRAKICVPAPLLATSVLTQNKGPGTEAHFWNLPPPPPLLRCAPMPSPPRKAIFGPPNATSPLHSRGSRMPSKKEIRVGSLTLAKRGAPKRAEMLCHPCILGDPQRQARRTKSEVIPNKGEQNQNALPHLCLLGAPKEGRNATSPLHSRGSRTPSTGNKIRNGPQQRGTKVEGTAAPLGIPNAKRGEQNHK